MKIHIYYQGSISPVFNYTHIHIQTHTTERQNYMFHILKSHTPKKEAYVQKTSRKQQEIFPLTWNTESLAIETLSLNQINEGFCH